MALLAAELAGVMPQMHGALGPVAMSSKHSTTSCIAELSFSLTLWVRIKLSIESTSA